MTDSPNLLVIRHEPCSSLGMLETAVKKAQIPFRYLDTSQGEILTEPVSHYSHIVILGGTVSAYEDDRYPFLQTEFKLLETAIAQEIPLLGICLGSQILARVLGARVYRGESGREAGWCDLELTEMGQEDVLFQGFPDQFKVFESHQDTFELPSHCVHLATSNMYPNQAFRYGNAVWAIQFHLEMDEHALGSCADLIEQELEESHIQDTTLAQLLAEAASHSPSVAPLADRFMQQFLAVNTQKILQASF
ncbi:type 1 glutamine amidotransferase [Stenomitos frigidus]|nr:type 1 glutamine amidotransferase [Stenomitos frigidus]